jgi:hypothetical protein
MINIGITNSPIFGFYGGGFWLDSENEKSDEFFFLPGFFLHGSLGLSSQEENENPYQTGTIEYKRFEEKEKEGITSYFHLGYGVGFYNRFKIKRIKIAPFIGMTGVLVETNKDDSAGNWITLGINISTSVLGIQYAYGFYPINSDSIGHVHQITLFLRLMGFERWEENNDINKE